jgi:hypothetical protein
MNKKIAAFVSCAAALLGCEISPVTDATSHRHSVVGSPIFDRFVFDDRLSSMDATHTHVELPNTNTETNSLGVSAVSGSQRVEGSFDIRRVNHTGPPPMIEYRLLFFPYEHFRHGAQQPNQVFGTGAVASRLTELGFTAEEIVAQLSQVHEKNSVSTANFMMQRQYLKTFGYVET